MSDVVIDTCCLINCCAAERLDQWLPAKEFTWYVPRTVRAEALYINFLQRELVFTTPNFPGLAAVSHADSVVLARFAFNVRLGGR